MLLLVGCSGLELKTAPPDSSPSADTAPDGIDTAFDPIDTSEPLTCPPEETACPEGCVDPLTDARNCGACGVVCVIPNGTGTCSTGLCDIGACDDGWGDCDGIAENGCETGVESASETTCTTTCNSQGTLDWTDVCAPVCTPPAETCDHTDEDCAGVSDNGALSGCRQDIPRSN